MDPRRHYHQLALLVPPLTILLVGCVIPIKTKTVIQGPTDQKQILPTEALISGKTTRRQVEEQYKGFAVEPGVPNLFWGRYRKSSWDVPILVGGPGPGSVADLGGRVWKVQNLLIDFDDNGMVRSVLALPDKELKDRFVTMQKAQAFPALDLSHPIHFAVMWRILQGSRTVPAEICLSATGISVTKAKHPRHGSAADSLTIGGVGQAISEHSRPEVTDITRAQISGVEFVSLHDYSASASQVVISMAFSKKNNLGKKFDFDATPEVALTIVRWMGQIKAE